MGAGPSSRAVTDIPERVVVQHSQETIYTPTTARPGKSETVFWPCPPLSMATPVNICIICNYTYLMPEIQDSNVDNNKYMSNNQLLQKQISLIEKQVSILEKIAAAIEERNKIEKEKLALKKQQ